MSGTSTKQVWGGVRASASLVTDKLLSEETMEICAAGHDIAAHAPGTWSAIWL